MVEVSEECQRGSEHGLQGCCNRGGLNRQRRASNFELPDWLRIRVALVLSRRVGKNALLGIAQ